MRRLLTTSGSPASGCMMFGEAPARLAVLVASLLSVGELLGLLDDFQQLFGLVAVACSRVPLQKGCQSEVRRGGGCRLKPSGRGPLVGVSGHPAVASCRDSSHSASNAQPAPERGVRGASSCLTGYRLAETACVSDKVSLPDRASAREGIALVPWCSLECTPACQAGGRGFKSRRDRHHRHRNQPWGHVPQGSGFVVLVG